MTNNKLPLFCGVCLLALLAVPDSGQAESETVTLPATTEGGISSDVLGRSGGRVHPFVSSSLTSTDNYQYVAADTSGDLITTLSPGVWLSLSRLKEQPESVATASQIPGGHAMPQGIREGVRRLHTFAMYRADMDLYARHDEDNTTQHHLDGMVQYSFPGGLTLGLDDQFARGFDPRETSSSRELDHFTTNLVGMNVDYKIGERLQVAARLTDFTVDYREGRNDFRDRTDRGISLSLPYALTAKTAIFTGYGLTDVSYDLASGSDSQDHDFFAGLSWKMTGKSSGRLQAGYGSKRFDAADRDSANYLSMGASINHAFSSKSSLQVSGFRRTQESSVITSDYILTDTFATSLRHRFTARWAASLTASHERDAYQGDNSGGRSDTIVALRPAMRFFWGERLFAELAYSFQDRDSSLPDYSYRVNAVKLGLEFAL